LLDQVDGIINYLKKNPVFQKLKRFCYAYRISSILEGIELVNLLIN